MLWWVGAAVVAYVVLRGALWLYAFFLKPPSRLRRFKGEWALVTGAGDGIVGGLKKGKAWVRALAARGVHVLMASRTEGKMLEVEAELRELHPDVQVAHVAVDFAEGSVDQAVRLVQEAMGGKNISILVNNVGILTGSEYPCGEETEHHYFEADSDKDIHELLRVNCEIPARVTKLVLPAMKERKKGLIVNTSSVASYVCPFMATYAATKAFTRTFSNSLSGELAPFNIKVLCIKPAQVDTPMLAKAHGSKRSAAVPSPENLVYSALRHVEGFPWLRDVSPWPVHGIFEKLAQMPLPMAIAGHIKFVESTSVPVTAEKAEKCRSLSAK